MKTTKRIGRPPQAITACKTLHIRLTVAERDALRAKAEKYGVRITTLVKRAVESF